MPLSHVALSIEPSGFSRDLAFPVILELLRSGFDESSRERIEQILDRLRIPVDLLRLDALSDGGMLASEKYLYPHSDGWLLRAAVRDVSAPTGGAYEARIDDFILSPDEFAQVMATLRQGAPWFQISQTRPTPTIMEEFTASSAQILPLLNALRSDDPGAFGAVCEVLSPRLAEAFNRALPVVAPTPAFEPVSEPGVYRREHASLVIRSRTTSILVDPISLWRGYANLWNAPTSREPAVDGIFVTHGHSDHFNIPSIVHSAGKAHVPVVVPHVPRPNCLSRCDMAAALRAFGQTTVLSPQWWSTLKIGDIEIDILPFYGEQPTRDGIGAPPAVRNWGNCYRFTTPEFSVLVLVDSGTDPAGSMEDVVRLSLKRRGRPDVLMTSLPVFLSPFFGGLMNHYLTVPVDRLRELFNDFKLRQLPSVTPGPDGVASLCDASSARYYLPYGNGLGNSIGERVTDVSGEGQPDESVLVGQIQADIRARRVDTSAVAWNPGDSAHFDTGKLCIRSHGAGPQTR